jgi:hypothetical protein
MTVYVVHPVRDNIAPALRFGDFKFITGGYVYGDLLEKVRRPPTLSVLDFDPDATPTTAEPTYDWGLPYTFQDSLEFATRQFRPDEDYLLVAGDHLQLLAFTTMLGQLHGSFIVLRYDRKLDDYIPVRLHSHLSRRSEAHLVRHPAPVLPSAHVASELGEDGNIGVIIDGQDGNQDIVHVSREKFEQFQRFAVLGAFSIDHTGRKPSG